MDIHQSCLCISQYGLYHLGGLGGGGVHTKPSNPRVPGPQVRLDGNSKNDS